MLQQLLVGDDEALAHVTPQQIATMVLQMSSKHRRIIVREKLRKRAYQIMAANNFLRMSEKKNKVGDGLVLPNFFASRAVGRGCVGALGARPGQA